LDVSKNTKLTYLDCRFNQLMALDLGKNKLSDLFCDETVEVSNIEKDKNETLLSEVKSITIDISSFLSGLTREELKNFLYQNSETPNE